MAARLDIPANAPGRVVPGQLPVGGCATYPAGGSPVVHPAPWRAARLFTPSSYIIKICATSGHRPDARPASAEQPRALSLVAVRDPKPSGPLFTFAGSR